MKKIIAIAMTTVSLVALTACSDTSNDENKSEEVSVSNYGRMVEKDMKLKDGRNVTCVVYDGNYSGGISCDWENTTH